MLKKILRWGSRRLAGRNGASRLRARGDEMRATGRLHDAAVLYAAAASFAADPRTRVQAGHMFKETGDVAAAEEQYLAALADLPDDPDLALQLGHFYKIAGRRREAIEHYRRAGELIPGWAEPLRELNRLGAWQQGEGDAESPLLMALAEPLDVVLLRAIGGASTPEAPGGVPVLRGVEAIRGICVSAASLERVELILDGRSVGAAPLAMAAEMRGGARKYVFNIWHDFTSAPSGANGIEVRITDTAGTARRVRRDVFVAPPLTEAAYPDSDGVVDPPADASLPLDAWIDGRPSMVRPARARYFTAPVRTILVIRADQLGDLVVSVPALRRLRALAPDARIVGLVTPANVDLARSLGLFDAVETLNWDRHAPTGVRRITAGEQERLRGVLRGYQPDVAIDLLVVSETRPVLGLSGAPCTIGFEDAAWPWLTVGVAGRSHDVRTGHEIAPHAARLLSVVERFGALLDSGATTMPLPSGGAALLEPWGLAPRRYIVMHAGARIVFSRWPGYADLAARLLAATDLRLVIFDQSGAMPASLREDARVRIVEGDVAFDQFEALLGFAAVFVGNDSGPKHLASLRGTPVVSVHSARVDWREWGQTQTGVVVSRRVPCAGCSLHADQVDECGRDYACINDIKVDEVFAAVTAQLA